MIVPVDELIDYKGNRYELTYAAIKRAIQINLTKDEEVRKSYKGKIVPAALRQILLEKVKYRIEEE